MTSKDGIEEYRSYLFSVAYNILGEVQEAEDIVQDTFTYFLELSEKSVKKYQGIPNTDRS